MNLLQKAVMLAAALGSSEVEQNGVRVRTDIQASVYTYEVTNVSARPIMRFEVGYSNGYHFEAPRDWQFDSESGVFSAWTADQKWAIYRGQTRRFSFNVTSKGAVLGKVDARVKTVGGEAIDFEQVWGAIPEPRGQVLLVAGVVLAIFALHTLISARAARKNATEN